MQKHISLAENAPTAHIFNNLTIDINSQDPYLLGFDSNLIPNFNILLFQLYLGEDSEYWKNRGDSQIIQHLLLGIPQIFGKFILTGLIFLQDTAGSTANTKYIDYSLDSERKNPNNQENHGLIFYRIQQGSLQIPNTLSIRWIGKEYPNNQENCRKKQ